jgi:TolB protein
MPERDDSLRRALQSAAPRPTIEGVRDEIARKRRGRELRRRAGLGVLAVAVVTGSIGGFVALRRSVETADGSSGVIAFSRTLRACFDHPSVGGPQVDAFAVSPDGTTQWNLTDEARFTNERARREEQITFAPDGTHFAWVDGYENRLYLTDVVSGDTERLVAGASEPAFSPNGSTIAYAGRRGIWTINAAGGDPVPLTDDGHLPTWSPDGSTIAFIRTEESSSTEIDPQTGDVVTTVSERRQSLWFMDPDGSDQRRMEVQPTGADWSVVGGDWAPEGERFAVEVSFGGNHDIVVVNTTTRTGVRLTDDPAADTSPTWSPDGSTIAFATGRWGTGVGHTEIATISPEGLDLRRVTDDCWDDFDPDWVATSASVESTPAWTPPPLPDLGEAGAAIAGQILYATTVEGVEDLFAIDPESGETTNLTADLISQFSPSWSPDHSEIAFGAYDERTGERGLYVMGADGSDLRLVADDGSNPDWHPDGSTIAFIAGDGRVMFVAPDGSDLRESGFSGARSMSWAPDGERLSLEIEGSLFVGTVATGETHEIVSGQPGANYEVAWSPRSDAIAFTHVRDVYVVNADGSDLTNLTPGGGDAYDRSPAWSPDGTQLVFVSDRGRSGAMRLYIMDADGADPQELSSRLGNGSPDPDW